MVVPGNHDVLRFLPVARWLTPMKRYFEYINAGRDMVVNLPGLDVVGLGTMRTWTIELGFITKQQLDYVEDSFKDSASNSFRVLVQHQSPKRFFKGLIDPRSRLQTGPENLRENRCRFDSHGTQSFCSRRGL